MLTFKHSLFGYFAQEVNAIWYPGRAVNASPRYHILLTSCIKWPNSECLKLSVCSKLFCTTSVVFLFGSQYLCANMKYKLIIPICITLIKFTVICAQPPRALTIYVMFTISTLKIANCLSVPYSIITTFLCRTHSWWYPYFHCYNISDRNTR